MLELLNRDEDQWMAAFRSQPVQAQVKSLPRDWSCWNRNLFVATAVAEILGCDLFP